MKRFDLETNNTEHEIVHVEANSPASAANMSPGDVVIEVNGRQITSNVTHEQIIEWIQEQSSLKMTILKKLNTHE